MTEEQVRENRLRRIAERQYRTLTKSKLRDSRAEGYGTWSLSETYYGAGGDGLTLDEVEALLTGPMGAEASDRFDRLRDEWVGLSADISLNRATDDTIEIETDLETLAWLAQELTDDRVSIGSVAVRFYSHDLAALTEWLAERTSVESS